MVYGRLKRLTFNPVPRKYPATVPTVKTLAEEVALLGELRFCGACAEMVPVTQFKTRHYGLSKHCVPCITKAVGW